MNRTSYAWLTVAIMLVATCLIGADKPDRVATQAYDQSSVLKSPVILGEGKSDFPVTVVGPSELPAGRYFVYHLRVDGDNPDWVRWMLYCDADEQPMFDPTAEFQSLDGSGKPILHYKAAAALYGPGHYCFMVLVGRGDKVGYAVFPLSLKAEPKPDPGPDPEPDPTPPPVPGTKIALVLHETGESTATTGQVLQGLRTWMKANLPDGRWRIEDQNLPAKLVQQSLSRAKTASLTLPCLGVATVSDAGEVVAFEGTALPATSAQAIAWVKERVK